MPISPQSPQSASAPSAEPPRKRPGSPGAFRRSPRGALAFERGRARAVAAPIGGVVRCGVCHGRDVSRDEVFDRGTLYLHECRRCAHRWTSRAADEQPVRISVEPAEKRVVSARVGRGVASAA